MKRVLFAMALLAPRPAEAAPRDFAIGVVLCSPTGLSVLQNFSETDAVQAAFEFNLYNAFVVQADYLFKQFVDEQVTPRFSDGLTILKGDGQFRGENGVIVKEESYVLILLYPYEALADRSQRIERIRALYKRLFDQESVLRVDDPFIVWVSF